MRRIFLDTNIILDLLAERHPFYEPIAKIVSLADRKEISLFTSPISFTTTEYVLSKFETKESALLKLQKFSILCQVAEANQETIDKSLFSFFKDFEDAVQYFCALQSNCDLILTRNKIDYKNSALPVLSASEFLASLLK
ncbi:MAG: PIN domain-containing protein [Cytophagales bacterium]|uniref:PIN domain nuclease n=1 Tax=Algoriphagus taiwanensis TaxID=1445656 RepID=A0ABQ6Q3Q0_9BACT|nr:MAG: PIN domain-containing protein [Cytophagales bacterium]GMQ34799.1 PIN domain nuclease [Algoriphagus taiwanensis]